MTRSNISSSNADLSAQPAGVESDVTLLIASPFAERLLLILSLLVALFFYANPELVGDQTLLISPILMIAGLATGIMTLALRSPVGIWVPMFWVRISLTAYFGVGTLVPYFVNDYTRGYIEEFYLFFVDDVLKFNLVVSTFCLIVIVLSDYILKAYKTLGFSKYARKIGLNKSNFEPQTVGWVLFAVGFVIKWFIILPVDFKILQIQLPSIVAEVGFGNFIGIFILGTYALKNKSKVIYLIWVVSVSQFFVGVIDLNKSDAIFPFIMLGLAYIFQKATITRIAVMFVGVLAAFLVISGPVAYGRQATSGIEDITFPESLTIRTEALVNYYSDRSTAQKDDQELQGGVIRFSYLNAGTFAISQYDHGQPGDSLRHVAAVWIPRFLYPDKPIITDIARDFNEAATGNPLSQSTPGLPAEGYWTGGWLGVFACAAMVALVMGFWSIYSAEALRGDAWHLFILVLMGMRVGGRMDGFIISDLIGPLPFMLIGHMALQFLNRLIAPERRATGRLQAA